MKVLLDSSAWLAHLFQEPGAEQVNLIFEIPDNEINISALSIPEIHGRLRAISKAEEWENVWATYSVLFNQILPADATVAARMIQLRTQISERLPLVDGLIAATAIVNGATLVHRDPHLATIPIALLPQIVLPEKA